MSPLREQLVAAREVHRAARYPGDLAAELLRRPPVWRRLVLCGSVGLSAVAASFLLAMTMLQLPGRVGADPGAAIARVPPLELPSLDEVTQRLPRMSRLESIQLPPLPEIPSWRSLLPDAGESDSAEREAV